MKCKEMVINVITEYVICKQEGAFYRWIRGAASPSILLRTRQSNRHTYYFTCICV